jgi:hypothetical protein
MEVFRPYLTPMKFFKKLDDCIYQSFTKIRIINRPNRNIEELFEKRKILRSKTDDESKSELEQVEIKLAEKCAQSNYDKIMEEIGDIDCEQGAINYGHLWKLKKKLSPKCRDPPLQCWIQMVA